MGTGRRGARDTTTRSASLPDRVSWALVAGFGAQIAGRLVDLRWHLDHDEFEGGAQQLEAHWLIWLATAFVLVVAFHAVTRVGDPASRRGYLVVLYGNVAYAVLAVVHFFQHLNHQEVDWTHLLLVVASVAAAAGVVWVVVGRLAARRKIDDTTAA